MAVQPAKTVLLTPKFRVSFPEVFKPKQFDPSQVPRYSVVALFDDPRTFDDKDKAKWRAILEACNKVALTEFKKPYKDLDRGVYRLPFHKGEEKTYAGYGPGIIYFTLAAYKRRPGIVAQDGITPITENGPDEFYPGCYARASCNPYAFNNKGKGIAIGLGNLQKLGDGERLDAFTSAADDFGSDPAEYDAGDAGGEFGDDPTA